MTKKARPRPPEVSPYLFPVLLAAFGLWCFYDGWLTTDPEMLEHALFNRVASGIMLPWAAYDFWKVRKYERKRKQAREAKAQEAKAPADDVTKGTTDRSS